MTIRIGASSSNPPEASVQGEERRVQTGAMTVPGGDEELYEALGESQRLGFLGARPIPEVVEHARMYVRALEGVTGVVADIGAGGGVPGLVIAHDRPDLALRLIDRRQKRTDFLERLRRRSAWLGSTEVVCADVVELAAAARGPSDDSSDRSIMVDAVVARGFGPPSSTLTLGASLVRPAGRIVISEPPEGDRWDPELLDAVGVSRLPPQHPDDRIVRFVRTGG